MNAAEESPLAQLEARARRYQRRKRLLRLADFLLGLAFLVVLLVSGWSLGLRHWAFGLTADPVGALALYLLVLTGISQALSFPLDFWSAHRLEHQFGLSNQRFLGWLKDWLKALAISLALALAAVELIYWMLRRLPDIWWLVCAAAFVAFFILLAQLAPVLLFPLFFKFEPLQDEELQRRLLQLSERVGARVRSVWLWKLSEKSKKANAALMGWGRTRRIVLADTLLEKHQPDEVEVVLAHELAHHVHHDLWRGMALQTALILVGFYAVHRALAAWSEPLGFAGPADFANLPLLLLVSGGVSLLALPAANAFSRSRERRADAFALRATGNRQAFIGAMEKLAEQNLAQRRPHPWIEFLFHSHPSVEKRIAFAQSWQSPAEG
ncbi:MAG TPA: M48 family metallopeptidase [Candidatus Acidoferrales bacterium]|nr:M48 family metallopeptidase [Candidatus Acidoferrales bacterium]